MVDVSVRTSSILTPGLRPPPRLHPVLSWFKWEPPEFQIGILGLCNRIQQRQLSRIPTGFHVARTCLFSAGPVGLSTLPSHDSHQRSPPPQFRFDRSERTKTRIGISKRFSAPKNHQTKKSGNLDDHLNFLQILLGWICSTHIQPYPLDTKQLQSTFPTQYATFPIGYPTRSGGIIDC